MIEIIDIILAFILIVLIINEIIKERQREKEYKAKLNKMEEERLAAKNNLTKAIHQLQKYNKTNQSNNANKNN